MVIQLMLSNAYYVQIKKLLALRLKEQGAEQSLNIIREEQNKENFQCKELYFDPLSKNMTAV